MGADQFLLTWNNHRSNFAEVFSQLRVQDQLVDVTLLCDGGSYPAHRLVLAACSPYFHQLFTKLPTQHPLVYLRDVRQAELEALLEFIYRGEVSVANSELTGLIKIAESLRIKGLGDVSQRDPTPSVRPEKRSATPFSNASSPSSSGRPRKVPRISSTNGSSELKNPEGEFHSLIPPPHAFGFRSQAFSHLLENQALAATEGDQDSRDSASPPFRESKLRSCLEGQDIPLNLPLSNLLAHSSGSSRLGGLLRKETERKKNSARSKGTQNSLEQDREQDREEKNIFNEVKQENLSCEETSNPLQSDHEAMLLPQFHKLYDSGEFGNSFLTKYTQLLSSFHQQQQQQQQVQQNPTNPPHLLQQNQEEETGSGFSSLIPSTVQEHQISPSPKDTKSLTCHLCGATIKHIANFRRHMKQHLNPRRFPCPWCSAAFGRKDNLKTHTRKHHPAEVEAQDQGSSAPLSTAGGADMECGEMEREGDDLRERVLNGLGEGNEETEEDDSLIIADEGDEEEEEEVNSGGKMDKEEREEEEEEEEEEGANPHVHEENEEKDGHRGS